MSSSLNNPSSNTSGVVSDVPGGAEGFKFNGVDESKGLTKDAPDPMSNSTGLCVDIPGGASDNGVKDGKLVGNGGLTKEPSAGNRDSSLLNNPSSNTGGVVSDVPGGAEGDPSSNAGGVVSNVPTGAEGGQQ